MDEIDAALAAMSNISKTAWFQLIGNRYLLRKDGPLGFERALGGLGKIEYEY